MKPHPTYLTPQADKALRAEAERRREALQHRRDLAERVDDAFCAEVHWIDAQRHERALMEIRMRNGTLYPVTPSKWGDL